MLVSPQTNLAYLYKQDLKPCFCLKSTTNFKKNAQIVIVSILSERLDKIKGSVLLKINLKKYLLMKNQSYLFVIGIQLTNAIKHLYLNS